MVLGSATHYQNTVIMLLIHVITYHDVPNASSPCWMEQNNLMLKQPSCLAGLAIDENLTWRYHTHLHMWRQTMACHIEMSPMNKIKQLVPDITIFCISLKLNSLILAVHNKMSFTCMPKYLQSTQLTQNSTNFQLWIVTAKNCTYIQRVSIKVPQFNEKY